MPWTISLLICFILYFSINWLIYGKSINGLLLPLIVPNSVISASILNLYLNSQIPTLGFLHFIIVNFTLTLLVIFMYKRSVTMIKRKCNIETNIKIAIKYYWLIIFLAILQLAIYYINVYYETETSRIAFQNEQWYSFFRLITWFLSPFSGLAIFIYIRGRHFFKAFSLLAISITASLLSGSKSGFMLAVLGSLFIYRDFFGLSKKEMLLIVKILILVFVIAVVNLVSMESDLGKIINRIIFFAEDSIMVYPSSEPTLACNSNSLLSNIHRGIARITGDERALRFDTLYGIALSNIYYGEGSTTGPNANMAAYAYCAYPGWSITIFIFIVSIYVLFLWIVFKVLLNTSDFFNVFGAPLFPSLIVAVATDYNNTMSIFTMLILLSSFIVVRKMILNVSFDDSRSHN